MTNVEDADLLREQAYKVADHLSGTLSSIEDAIEKTLGEEFAYLEENSNFLLHIDDQIFSCVFCGWWLESSEVSGEKQNGFYCYDCEDDDET